MIVGHEAVVRDLVSSPSPVCLLSGPSSVGKWAAAEHARRTWGVWEPDVLRVRDLRVSSAHDVRDFVSYAPSSHALRVALVSTDGASSSACNALLLALEELAPTSRVILVSSQNNIPAPLRLRAREYLFSLLTSEQVAEVLVRERGFSESSALRLAKASGGTIAGALAYAVEGHERSEVVKALRALRDGDEASLRGLAGRWTDDHTRLLSQALTEACTGTFERFTAAEVGDISKGEALRVLMAASRIKGARPRFFVALALLPNLRVGA